jgi:5-methylcytosine-specific restriction endonuclease McrA
MPYKDSTKKAAKNREYVAAHREEMKAYHRAYREAHSEEIAAYEESRREKRRAYREAHREEIAAYAQQWQKEHRAELAVKFRASQKAHAAEYTAYRHNREAREQEAGGTYTATEWRALCTWFGDVCLRCGAIGELSVDHVVPISKGGSNAIMNLQPLCKPCNSRKHTKTIDYRDPGLLNAFLQAIGATE